MTISADLARIPQDGPLRRSRHPADGAGGEGSYIVKDQVRDVSLYATREEADMLDLFRQFLPEYCQLIRQTFTVFAHVHGLDLTAGSSPAAACEPLEDTPDTPR